MMDFQSDRIKRNAGRIFVLCCVGSVASLALFGWAIYSLVTWITASPVQF